MKSSLACWHAAEFKESKNYIFPLIVLLPSFFFFFFCILLFTLYFLLPYLPICHPPFSSSSLFNFYTIKPFSMPSFRLTFPLSLSLFISCHYSNLIFCLTCLTRNFLFFHIFFNLVFFKILFYLYHYDSFRMNIYWQ